MARDPVCGMDVDPQTAPASAEFEGVTYYFCAQGCKDDFLDEPRRYLDGGEPQARKGYLRRLFGRG